jgi:hypothetical protein
MEGRSSRRGLNVGLTRELCDVFHTKCFGSAMRPRIAFSTKRLERKKLIRFRFPASSGGISRKRRGDLQALQSFREIKQHLCAFSGRRLKNAYSFERRV